jgi:hypothetical protein
MNEIKDFFNPLMWFLQLETFFHSPSKEIK